MKTNLTKEDKLFEAIENNDLLTIRSLIKAGVNIEARTYWGGDTPLIIATSRGKKSVINALIDNGARINAKCYDGDSSLIISTRGDNKEIVEFLLARGANVEEKDNYGNTPLIIATENNNKEIMSLLLAYKANIEAKNDEGYTPLLIAIENGKKELAEFLISKGANPNAEDSLGTTPLMIARWKEITPLIIKKKGKINKQIENLCKYIEKIDIYKVEDIIKAGIDLRGHKGYLSLVSAIKVINLKMMKMLINNGAKINTRGIFNNYTLLMEAIETKLMNYDVIEFLIDQGVPLEARDSLLGDTALLKAIRMNRYLLVSLLIDKGVSKKTKNFNGDSPLKLAIKLGLGRNITDLLY